MATLPRRKRGLVFKIILAIPVVWFAFIGLAVITGNHDDGDGGNPRFQHARDVANDNHGGGDEGVKQMNQRPAQQPVIEKPNPDKMRLEEKMRADAAEELRLQEERRRVEKMAEDAAKRITPSPPHPHREHPGNVAPPIHDNDGQRLSMEEVKKHIPTASPDAPGKYHV